MNRPLYIIAYSAKGPEPEAVIQNAIMQNAMGVYWYTDKLDSRACRAANEARTFDLDFILGFPYKPPAPHVIEDATEITHKLAVGLDRAGNAGEFDGNAEMAMRYKLDAIRMGYEWVCPLIHPWICWDMKAGGELQKALGDTQCFVLTGYVLARYIWDDKHIPCHQDYAIVGKDLRAEYGMTLEALQNYLRPMDIWTGGGFQRGIDAGTEIYAEQMGFSGVVSAYPLTTPDQITFHNKPRYAAEWGPDK